MRNAQLFILVYNSVYYTDGPFFILFVLYVAVFPTVPAAPGMPCQGEDRKYNITVFFFFYSSFPFYCYFIGVIPLRSKLLFFFGREREGRNCSLNFSCAYHFFSRDMCLAMESSSSLKKKNCFFFSSPTLLDENVG